MKRTVQRIFSLILGLTLYSIALAQAPDLKSLANEAKLLDQQGQYSKASAAYEKLVADTERQSGADSN